MGSIFKAAKKVAKRISRPVSKITKGIAKGIARVGKSVMKGVAKINKKLGPLGMIAMSIAMPYALGGLSSIVGQAGVMHPMYGMSNATGLMAKKGFLGAIGQVGNAIRTGYQATTLKFSNFTKGITKSISDGFQSFAGKFKGDGNIFSRISNGAKRLFTDAKAKAVEWRSKLTFGKPTDGTVNVSGWGHPISGQGSTMTTGQVEALYNKGMIQATDLSSQTLGKTISNSDRFINDIINTSWEKNNMVGWDSTAMDGFKNYKDALKLQNDGIYNAKEIGDMMKSGLETNATADGTWTNFNYSKSKDFAYSPPHDKYIFNGNDTFKVNNKSTLKDKTKNWIKKSVKSKTYDTLKKSLLNQDIDIKAPPINYAMMGAMHTGSTMGQDAKWSGTDLKGASQGSLLHGTFSAQQIDQINNYYRHMNI